MLEWRNLMQVCPLRGCSVCVPVCVHAILTVLCVNILDGQTQSYSVGLSPAGRNVNYTNCISVN